MTDLEFWTKLDKVVKNGSPLEVGDLIRQAYDEDLGLICGVRHEKDGTRLAHIFVSLDDDNTAPGCRYMICYTTPALGFSDISLPEGCEIIPIRKVVNHCLKKPAIGGLLFNRHRTSSMASIVPKQFFGSEEDFREALRKIMSGDALPFGYPLECLIMTNSGKSQKEKTKKTFGLNLFKK